MSERIFEEAYARVRGRHSDKEWFSLMPRDITKAIYGEIRAMDQERIKATSNLLPKIAMAAE